MTHLPVLAELLRLYAEGVDENLRDDEPGYEGEFPVVEDYLNDAARMSDGELPLHDETWSVLDELAGPGSGGDGERAFDDLSVAGADAALDAWQESRR